jgi:ABC-type glycerol-3-phosphate transport system substrate-binding protein
MEENSAAWKNSFFPKALAVNEFSAGNAYGIKSGIFGVPIDVMTIEMVYNKGLLHKIGFRQPPQTFTELLEVGRRLKENNLQGLISGWGEVWLINCFANGYAFNLMGKDKLLATIRGEVAYTDPDWVKVLELFQKMRDSGLFYNGIVTMVNKTAEQLFANEKAVFAFNGSWCVNVYRGMNPDLDYGVILPPKASEAFPMSIWGGAGSSFMVNSRSARKEEAVKFLRWLTERDQQAYLSEATNNLPANRHSLSRIPEVLAQFSQGMDYATHPNIWGVSEFPAVLEALGKGIQLIIIGEKTPEQVAAEAQRVKERELAKKK